MSRTYNVMRIVRGTTVDGPGFRTSIYLAGCRHHCPGCHNPSTWDDNAGEVMSLDEILDVIEGEGYDVTLTGGDPLCHPEATAVLAAAVHRLGFSVWMYTGYTWEEICAAPALYAAVADVDAIVDGRYVENLRDPDLLFRGSSNQRILALTHGSGGRVSAAQWRDPYAI